MGTVAATARAAAAARLRLIRCFPPVSVSIHRIGNTGKYEAHRSQIAAME
jgi:hypothetical protein